MKVGDASHGDRGNVRCKGEVHRLEEVVGVGRARPRGCQRSGRHGQASSSPLRQRGHVSVGRERGVREGDGGREAGKTRLIPLVNYYSFPRDTRHQRDN